MVLLVLVASRPSHWHWSPNLFENNNDFSSPLLSSSLTFLRCTRICHNWMYQHWCTMNYWCSVDWMSGWVSKWLNEWLLIIITCCSSHAQLHIVLTLTVNDPKPSTRKLTLKWIIKIIIYCYDSFYLVSLPDSSGLHCSRLAVISKVAFLSSVTSRHSWPTTL